MGDIFDQVASQMQGQSASPMGQSSPAPQGDIFDQVASRMQGGGQPQQQKQPDIFDHVAAQMQQPQYGMAHNFAGGMMANAGDYLANLGIRGAGELGAISPQATQQLINAPGAWTYDPRTIAGKVGGAIGQAIPIMASGPAAPATAFASAAEQERERVQPDVTKSLGGGQSIDVLAQGALNAVLTKLMPGQAGSKAVLNALPELQGTVANALKNIAVQSGVSFTEGDAYNAAGNAIRKMTGQQGGSMNPLSGENLQAGAVNAAAGGGLQAAHELAQGDASRPGVPTISPEQVKALLLPEAPKAPPEPSPAAQAGGLNLTTFQEAAEHAQNLTNSLKALSSLQDQQLAQHAQANPPADVTPPVEPKEIVPLSATDKADQRAQEILAKPPEFTPIPADEGPTKPGEIGTSTPLPPLLDGATAKVRLPKGSENPSVPMEFEHPYDKAAYLAANARGGKLATAANDYLGSEGFTPDEITAHAAEVKQAATAHAAAGKDTPLPAVYQDEQNVGTSAQVQTDRPVNPGPNLRRRAGMVQVPESVSNFVEQDIRPKLDEAVDGIKGNWSAAKNFFGLQAGDEATAAKNILRGRQAELTQRVQSVREAFGKAKTYFDAQPIADTRSFIDDVENGRAVSNPAEQPIADAMREMLDNRRDQLVNRKWLDSFIENYFPHLWEDKEKAANVFSKSPMAGGKGFLRQRTFPTMQEGLDAGLTPLYENPVEAFMARVHQVDKFITAHDAFKSMEGDGLLKQVNATDPTADGFARINDNISRIYIKPTSKGGLNLAKRFDAPQAVASVINNFTDPGFRSQSGAYLLDKAVGLSNVMNSVQLGLSPFHAIFTSSNAVLTKLATGARQLMRADLPGAAKSLLTAPIAPAEYYQTGSKMFNEWMKPGTTDPQTAAYVDWLKQAGGRVSLDSHYDNGFRAKFKEALSNSNPIGAAVRAPFAGLEAVASPIMDYLVPRMKLGAFLDEAKENLARLPDEATAQDRKSALGNAWDSVDNRFGQLTYDNIFWNQLAKGAGMASTRSLGWNLGTFRELGGGLADVARGKIGTGRAAYTAMLPVFAAGLAGAAQKLIFNQPWHPQSVGDLFTVHTGEKDEQGHEITYSPATYMKDVMGFARHPILTLEHKASPALAAMIELMNNRDYRGAEIRNPDDSAVTQLGQLGKYAASEATPFSIANATRNSAKGVDAKTVVASALGFTRNPAEWSMSDAEIKARDIQKERFGDESETPEQAERFKAKAALIEEMNKASADKRRSLAVQAVHTGVISGTQIPDALKMARYDTKLERDVARMVAEGQKGLDSAFKVWDVASDAEQAKLRPIISGEISRSRTLTATEKQSYRAKLASKEVANASQ